MNFWTNTRGNMLIIAGLAVPALLTALGAGLDYSYLFLQEKRLQAAVDASAISAARELQLVSMGKRQIQIVAKNALVANLKSNSGGVTLRTQIRRNPASITVEATQRADLFIMNKFAANGGITLAARAVARLVGGTPVCVIGLDDRATGTVSLDSNAILKAESCAVYSNSTSSSGLISKSNAILHAAFICSAGGAVGKSSNFKPDTLTDCPAATDPLADRPAPPVGGCRAKNLEIIDITTTLHPGTYCGGLSIDGNARVHFRPGVYVIKDGPLNVDSNSEISGDHVGFYFTGKNARFRFASNAVVALSAPRHGAMAGLLFFEARNAKPLRRFEIMSNYANELVGTIYLPNGTLVVDADNDVADQSAYTAIIVRRMELKAGPRLVLNTDYETTDVPVPEGVGDIGRSIVLVE